MPDQVKQQLLDDVSRACERLEDGEGENIKAVAHAVAKQGRLLVAVAGLDLVTQEDCAALRAVHKARTIGPLSAAAGATPPSAAILLWFIGKAVGWW